MSEFLDARLKWYWPEAQCPRGPRDCPACMWETRKAKLNPKPKKFAPADKDLEGFPLLQALAQREELVRNGKLTTIIYIRDKNSKKQEVSGYIDYAHRLKSENWEHYFERKKRVMPHTSDLSFYNWCAPLPARRPPAPTARAPRAEC